MCGFYIGLCNTFLQIYLGKFNGNIFQAPKDFFISNCILLSLKEGMSKASSLKTFHHIQSFTTSIDFKLTIIMVFRFAPSSLT